MAINRRRAPSSTVSSEKKLGGHAREQDFALSIGGEVLRGTQKADIRDKFGNTYSVKSGKKWQIFLYNINRICASKHLNIIEGCVNAFTNDPTKYFADRELCIAYKENYVRMHGRDDARKLSNRQVELALGQNEYMQSKNRLMLATEKVRRHLEQRENIKNFLDEAIFNCDEVGLLAIKDTTLCNDNLFKVFSKDDVLEAFCDSLSVATSVAGNVPEDYNVMGQKTLLRYNKNGRLKNLAELEIRNDREEKFRLVRFNMYSKDALTLLLDSKNLQSNRKVNNITIAYGNAIQLMRA